MTATRNTGHDRNGDMAAGDPQGWYMMIVARWTWRGARAAARWLGSSVTAIRHDDLHRTMRVDPQWHELVDGRAKRLDSNTTITTTPAGRFADRDPLATSEGWRNGWRGNAAIGWVLTVATAVGIGWLRGTGPLAGLRSYKANPPSFGRPQQQTDASLPASSDR